MFDNGDWSKRILESKYWLRNNNGFYFHSMRKEVLLSPVSFRLSYLVTILNETRNDRFELFR